MFQSIRLQRKSDRGEDEHNLYLRRKEKTILNFDRLNERVCL